MTELYKRLRPKSFKTMVGQDAAVKQLETMVANNEVPHTLLFVGPSGCGKTTAARILKKRLGCSDHDYHEMNAATSNGIEMVRNLENRVGGRPMNGSCKIYMIDECHQLTTQAQNGLLKLLEDTPKHAYFIMATTDPQKLLKTIITRSCRIELKGMSTKALETLVEKMNVKLQMDLSEEVMDKVVEYSDGSARQCMVLLDAIKGLDDEEEQLNSIKRSDDQAQAIEVARKLLTGRRFTDVSNVLKNLPPGTDYEGIRWLVLAFMNKALLGGGKYAGRAYVVIDCFREPFFNTKAAGLSAACWEVFNE